MRHSRQEAVVAKLYKKVKERENLSSKQHMEANMYIGPTRKEPANSPVVMCILPDLDPLQKQLNRIENTVNHEARCVRRRAWKK